MYLVGIDIGGTSIKIGLIQDGQIIAKVEKPTNAFDLIKQIETETTEIILSNKLTLNDISGIGVGCPGVIIGGKVIESANLKLFDCDLTSILVEFFGVPVVVKNDADMATLAEHRFGAGVGAKNMLMLTIGTGVGGGIIINNEIYEGNGGAGELGHITYVKDGIECNCGRKGCYEKYVSAMALSNRAKEIMLNMENNIPLRDDLVYASDLSDKYDEGDKCAIKIVDEYVEDFANLVLSLCNNFRPEKIVIGGGICHAPKIIGMMADRCKMYNYGYKGSPAVQIVRAKLGNNAGILGAVTCF